MLNRREFARETYLVQSSPWGLYVTGAAICSDGKVRKLKRIAETADTFFSVPASVTVNGRTVAGYITVDTEEGFTTGGCTDSDDDPSIVKFNAYTYCKNHDALPPGMWKREAVTVS